MKPISNCLLLALYVCVCAGAIAWAILAPSVCCGAETEHGYHWRQAPACNQWGLFHHGRQVGTWDGDKGEYRPFTADGRGWGAAVRPPVEPPTPNMGLRLDLMREKGKGVTFQGHEISRDEARKLISDGIPDNSGKLRGVVIGSEAFQKKVLGELTAKSKDGVIWQGFDPDNRLVKDVGYKTDGDCVYVLEPGGRVLHRQDGYDGPAALEGAVGKCRRPSDGYDKSKDPDLRKGGKLVPWRSLFAGSKWLWFAGAVVAQALLIFALVLWKRGA